MTEMPEGHFFELVAHSLFVSWLSLTRSISSNAWSYDLTQAAVSELGLL